MRSRTIVSSTAALVAACLATTAQAAPILKDNNTVSLNDGSSWVGGIAPGALDTAVWDATVTAANSTLLGADLSWQGIQVTNPGGAVTIGVGNALTLGSSGIDMSAATQNLSLAPSIALGSAQTWNVAASRFLTINGAVTAAAGNTLTKDGGGTLIFNAGSPAFAANINLNGGTLSARSGAVANPLGTGAIAMASGTTFFLDNNGSASTFAGNAVTIASGGSVNFGSDSAANGFSGAVTGDAASTLNITGPQQVSFSAGNQQLSNFLGTVQIGTGQSLRFSSTSTGDKGGANTSFNVLGNVQARNTGNVHLGELTGNGTLTGATGQDGTTTFTVGEKGTSTTFSGVIADSTGLRRAALTKAGAGTLTLTGASTYTGATAANGGTLFLNGTHATSGNYTVGASGTLGGTGAINFAAATNVVTVNGKLAPGAAGIESLDINTGDLTLAGTADFEIDLTAGTFDDVNVGDLLTYGGVLNLAFAGADADGATFDIFDFANFSGAFTQINATGLTAEQTASFDAATGVVTVTAVPEPAALSLLCLGGLAICARRHRAI